MHRTPTVRAFLPLIVLLLVSTTASWAAFDKEVLQAVNSGMTNNGSDRVALDGVLDRHDAVVAVTALDLRENRLEVIRRLQRRLIGGRPERTAGHVA